MSIPELTALMNAQTTNRLDPMTNVMHYNLLEVAHSLMARRQNRAYWDAVPVPRRPVGQVRYEVARQVSTFVVPLLGLVWAYWDFGLKGLLLGLPVAWFAGFMLDKWLQSAINKKCRRDEKIDSGRYRATKFLAAQMGMAPRDITLPIIYKMAEDFRVVDSLKRAAEAKAEAERKDAIARSVRRPPYEGSAAEPSATTGAVIADTYVEQYDDEPAYSYLGGFNPNTGLPMIEGMPIDVAGNQFGTGWPD